MNIKSHENSNVNDISHEEWLIVFEGYPNIKATRLLDPPLLNPSS